MTTALTLFREITSIRSDGTLVHGVVLWHKKRPKMNFVVLPVARPARESAQPFRYDTEGTHWIRGYHTPDAPAVLALRATQGLLRKG